MGGFLPCKEGEGKRRRREVTSHTQALQRQRALSKKGMTESAVAGLAPFGRFVVSFLKGGTQA
jgi:hypothetical protein